MLAPTTNHVVAPHIMRPLTVGETVNSHQQQHPLTEPAMVPAFMPQLVRQGSKKLCVTFSVNPPWHYVVYTRENAAVYSRGNAALEASEAAPELHGCALT